MFPKTDTVGSTHHAPLSQGLTVTFLHSLFCPLFLIVPTPGDTGGSGSVAIEIQDSR